MEQQDCSQTLPFFASQAKDSDDEEEVVHVDRDHFMDEFFEQVTEPDPQPTTAFFLAPRTPIPLSIPPSPWPFTNPSGSGPFP